MARQKERNCCEATKAENRNLKKQVQSLKKEIHRQNKRKYQLERLEELAEDMEIEAEVVTKVTEQKNPCPNCQSELEYTDLGIKWLIQCSTRPKCKFRKSEVKK